MSVHTGNFVIACSCGQVKFEHAIHEDLEESCMVKSYFGKFLPIQLLLRVTNHMLPCVFCNIIAQKDEASIVYQGESVTAFMDIHPVVTGHLLVVPNDHSADLEGLSEHQAGRLFVISRKMAGALRASAVPCDGVNLFLADGRVAGQTVFHVHVHVIPRFQGDGFDPLHPIGIGSRPPRGELDKVAGMIKESFS
jgi:histidine triad (HIT) family protein